MRNFHLAKFNLTIISREFLLVCTNLKYWGRLEEWNAVISQSNLQKWERSCYRCYRFIRERKLKTRTDLKEESKSVHKMTEELQAKQGWKGSVDRGMTCLLFITGVKMALSSVILWWGRSRAQAEEAWGGWIRGKIIMMRWRLAA